MKPVSLRFITDNAERLVDFYQEVTGLPPTWYTDDFTEFVTPTFTLAIGSTSTIDIFGDGAGRTTDNRTPILEFLVDDVDQKYEKLKKITSDFVLEPTTQPWGNRSVMFRDPDGHLLNFFTPVSEQAIKKFNPRSKLRTRDPFSSLLFETVKLCWGSRALRTSGFVLYTAQAAVRNPDASQ